MKPSIKCYELRAEIFDRIIEDFSSYIEVVPTTDPYIKGYPDKDVMYYDEKEYLICEEYIVNYYCPIEECTDWKQCRVRRVENASNDLKSTITGPYAWNYMMNILKKKYSEEEIYEIFEKFSVPYDPSLIQFHYDYDCEFNKIEKIENCYKYDINGAHTDALVEMFPKCEEEIKFIYEKRHTNPNFKNFTNFFVGMIKHKGYDGAYNWIVQRTTKHLFKAIKQTQGLMIYANTDGYVVSDPKRLLNASKSLGEFKLEYTGDVYVYRDKNYIIYQMNDELVGSCLNCVRKYIDLRQGKVVHYNRRRNEYVDANGTVYYNVVAENIVKETI